MVDNLLAIWLSMLIFYWFDDGGGDGDKGGVGKDVNYVRVDCGGAKGLNIGGDWNGVRKWQNI